MAFDFRHFYRGVPVSDARAGASTDFRHAYRGSLKVPVGPAIGGPPVDKSSSDSAACGDLAGTLLAYPGVADGFSGGFASSLSASAGSGDSAGLGESSFLTWIVASADAFAAFDSGAASVVPPASSGSFDFRYFYRGATASDARASASTDFRYAYRGSLGIPAAGPAATAPVSIVAADAFAAADLAAWTIAAAAVSIASADSFAVADAQALAAALAAAGDPWGASESSALDATRLVSSADAFSTLDLATWEIAVAAIDVSAADSFGFGDGLQLQMVSSSTLFDGFTGFPTANIDGSKWTEHGSVASGNSDIRIDDTGGRAHGARAGISIYHSNSAPPSADQSIEWDYETLPEPTSGVAEMGFGLRVSTSADTGYYGVSYRDLGAATNEWRIVRRSSGTETTLASATASISVGTVYRLAFSVVGSTLTLTVDGVQQAQATDATIAATGRYGIYIDPVNTNSSTQGGRLDNLRIAGSPVYRRVAIPEVITLLVGESYSLAERSGQQAAALSGGGDPIGLGDSGGVAATLGGRDSFAFAEAYVLAITGSAIVVGTDRFSFAERLGGLDASLERSESFDATDELALTATLAESDSCSWADVYAPPSLSVSIADSFGFAERISEVGAELSDSEPVDCGELLAIVVSTAVADAFEFGDAATVEVYTPPIDVSSSDSAGVDSGAAIVVRTFGRDVSVLADRGAVLAALASGDSADLLDLALVSLAAVLIASVDAAGASESHDLLAHVADLEPWGWLESTALGVGVVSRDAFDADDLASYSRGVVATDRFGFADAHALEQYVGSLVYRIYANDGAGGPIDYDSVVAATTDLSWTSWAIPANSDYSFAVRVFGLTSTLEEKNLDAAVRVVTDSAQHDVTNRPAPPTGLRALPLAGGMVRVEWTYRQPPSRRPAGFRVYQGVGSVDYGTIAATVPFGTGGIADAFSAVLGPLADGSTYLFAVRTYNATGEEPNTTTASATADATGPAPPSGVSINTTAGD